MEELILDVVCEIVSYLDNSVIVVVVFCLRGRYGKLGFVKILLFLFEEKKNVLREKCNIRNVEKYRIVFIWFSKFYIERLIEFNVWIMLSEFFYGN